MALQVSRMFRWGLALVLSAGACVAGAQTIQVSKANRTIAVTSSGTATATADRAVLNLGYIVYGASSEAAYAEASKRSNAIADALARVGVAKDQMESQSQSVNETQAYENQNLSPAERAARQFRAEQSWTVRLKAGEAAGVLNAAVAAGANNSGNIQWSVADDEALQAKAAAKALANDKRMAATMAQGLGVTLGPLLYASNQAPSRAPMPVFHAMMAKAAGPEAVKPLSLEPQRITDSATVYAVFAIQ
jgi:uncharacterized protein YggE